MSDLAGKPGNKTSEYKVMVGVGMTVLATLLSELLGSGLLSSDSKWATIASLILTVLGALGYGAMRTMRKNAKTNAMAAVEAAKLNPPK